MTPKYLKLGGSWASTNRRNATNDITPAGVLILLILAASILTTYMVLKITTERVNQDILIERGLLRTGPFWGEEVK